ncbi:unnamed protein product, partial [Musa hybrid cultivar]
GGHVGGEFPQASFALLPEHPPYHRRSLPNVDNGMCLLDIAGLEGIMQYVCVEWKRTGSLPRQ